MVVGPDAARHTHALHILAVLGVATATVWETGLALRRVLAVHVAHLLPALVPNEGDAVGRP